MIGQVRGDVPRARADLHHRASGGVGDHPVQQPGLERLPVQFVDQLVGVRSATASYDDRTRASALPPRPRAPRPGRPPGGDLRGRLRPPARADASNGDPAGRRAVELAHQRLRPRRHPAQARLDLFPVGEPVEPLGAGAQLTGACGPAVATP